VALTTTRCADYYKKVVEEAKERGLYDALKEQLDYLNTFACPDDDKLRTRCLLFPDFAPLSFTFMMQMRNAETGEYEDWFNGGLIFYEGKESGAGAPQLSVTLSGRSDSRWEVHT
jgi:hypothetical protein